MDSNLTLEGVPVRLVSLFSSACIFTKNLELKIAPERNVAPEKVHELETQGGASPLIS